jgi:hypothetical protein
MWLQGLQAEFSLETLLENVYLEDKEEDERCMKLTHESVQETALVLDVLNLWFLLSQC